MRRALALGSVLLMGAAPSYRVEIPRSRIEYPAPNPAPERAAETLDAGLSSWAPSGFRLPGRVHSSVAFSRASVPSLYLNFLRPLSSDALLKTGVNWMALSRSAPGADQTIQLISVRLGLELAPSALATRVLSPYFSASLLPSFALAGRSAYDDGTIYFGVPLEGALGVKAPLSIAGAGAELTLGMMATAGTVHHSSIAGLGVQGGIRVAL